MGSRTHTLIASARTPARAQGQYRKAHAVKTEADELYLQELSATQTNHEAGVALKRMKLQARQQGARQTQSRVDGCVSQPQL